MPTSATSVVAKLATNPATAQTVPKSLRPLREKKHRALPYSTQRAQRTQNITKYRDNKDSTENLCGICGICVKKNRIFPYSTQRTQSSIYISSHANLCDLCRSKACD